MESRLKEVPAVKLVCTSCQSEVYICDCCNRKMERDYLVQCIAGYERGGRLHICWTCVEKLMKSGCLL